VDNIYEDEGGYVLPPDLADELRVRFFEQGTRWKIVIGEDNP